MKLPYRLLDNAAALLEMEAILLERRDPDRSLEFFKVSRALLKVARGVDTIECEDVHETVSLFGTG